MNTFLPCGDHAKTAVVLDWRRLNKQLTEGIQICRILIHNITMRVGDYGWMNHPVSKLWQTVDGEWLLPELVYYVDTLSAEWHKRPQCRKRHEWQNYSRTFGDFERREPAKLRWPNEVYASHRRNLIRKDPTHYRHYLRLVGLPYDEEPMEGYVWYHPTRID